MPWNESNLMTERIKFIARLLDGESMTALWYKIGTVPVLYHYYFPPLLITFD